MKIAFVIPWYGDIPGGAESECKNTAERLNQKGIGVEILTTCAKEFLSDWSTNYYREGVYYEGGLIVRRFSLRKRNKSDFDLINYKLMNNQPVTFEEEKVFIQEMINSPNLYSYIRENGGDYDYFIFIPYMFGTTFYGSQIYPEKTILIPCLHDESYAYMEIYKPMFKSVKTILFHTKAEKELFNKIVIKYSGHQSVIGEGVDTHFNFNPDRFKEKYKITDPFILYAGRRDSGKMVNELIYYFSRFIECSNQTLKLVLIGKGNIHVSKNDTNNVIDLGFITKNDKYDAYAAASIFCLPSITESFSLVMMEAWLCGTPNLVNGRCKVTREHCILSNGGLYYDNFDEFVECLTYFLTHKKDRQIMASNGRDYVLKNYDWDIILSKYISLFNVI